MRSDVQLDLDSSFELHLDNENQGVSGGRYRTRTYDLVRVKHAL